MKYAQAKPLLDRLCDLAILFHASSELRSKMFEALNEHIPHLDQGCFERGCPMDDELSRCPKCGGPADNGHDRCLPPNPYHCTKCMADLSLESAMATPMAMAQAYENGWNAAKSETATRRLTDDQIGRIWFRLALPGVNETTARLIIREAEKMMRGEIQ